MIKNKFIILFTDEDTTITQTTRKEKLSWLQLEDDYSWIHQDNCLEILRDTSKLNPEVRQYLEEENIFKKI